MYFHAFSDNEGAYIPNTHLARRFTEERWLWAAENDSVFDALEHEEVL